MHVNVPTQASCPAGTMASTWAVWLRPHRLAGLQRANRSHIPTKEHASDQRKTLAVRRGKQAPKHGMETTTYMDKGRRRVAVQTHTHAQAQRISRQHGMPHGLRCAGLHASQIAFMY